MGFNTFPCNPYPISTEELNKGNNDDLNTRVAALESDVSDLNSNKANQITIAPFFNAETAYTAGDLVYYNGLSYRCTNDHEGEWDADDFTATTVANELDTLKSGLTNLIVMEEVELAFTGTVTLDTYSYIILENIAKAGYKIVSLQPRLVSPDAHLNINTMVFGSMDEQIIAKCNYADSTGSYTDPEFYLKITYLKINN